MVRGVLGMVVALFGCAAASAPTSAPQVTSSANAAGGARARVDDPKVPPVSTDALSLAGVRVAVTLDDLGVSEASAEPELSRRLIATLGDAGVPVAVFANCVTVRPETLLLWRAAGATIGNHTATHRSVDANDERGKGADAAWWDDVESCHRRLSTVLGEPVRYFRFPYLRAGGDEATKREAARRLETLGYVVAPVTAATSEWLIAGYYDTALERHDADLAAELAAAYVEHMTQTLAMARDFAERKVGRDVLHITLLHVNRLAADHLADVLTNLRAKGVTFISLAEALSDPVFARPDAYVGGCGCSWLARIAPPLTPSDAYVFGDEEDALRARFERRVRSE